MKLYAHQKEIIDADPKKTGLFLGTGSGKTRTALLLARGRTLVIAPKTQVEDKNWERELLALVREGFLNSKQSGKLSIELLTFDKFKAAHETLPAYDTVIVDEAHGMLGVTPNTRQRKRQTIPKASQRFDALSAYLERTQPTRLYLCTATIMKSPMTVWAAGKILGRTPGDISDFFKFRDAYYHRLPMPGREVWSPRSDNAAKDTLAKIVLGLGHVGRLEDFFDVPDQTFKTVHVELTPLQKSRIKELKLEYPEPIVLLGKRHQVENGVLTGNDYADFELFSNAKIDVIKDYALEFPRMVIFARYTLQIAQLKTELEHLGYKVLTLTGDTVDRGAVLSDANAAPACIFIAQAQISAGWELPHFPVMVFASRTYSFVDYDQALGRIQRANNIKKNLYINLVVKDGTDEAVDKALENKSDFNERIYAEAV